MHLNFLMLTVVDCGPLTTPTNGTVDLSGGTVYQSIAYYSCNIRHKLSGAATRICQADGTWSGNPPTCDGMHMVIVTLSLNFCHNLFCSIQIYAVEDMSHRLMEAMK